MYLQNLSLREMKPREHEQLIAGPDSLQSLGGL
jgi:hypothetical protein